MKQIKYLLMAFIALFTCISFSACSNDDEGGGGSSNSDDAEITSGGFDKTYANNDALQIKGTNNLSLESDEVYTLAKKQFTVKTDTSKDAWAAAITANCRSHITPCAPALVTPKSII